MAYLSNNAVCSNDKYQLIYENFPVGILQEDWSEVKSRLDKFRSQGVVDLSAYLSDRPSLVYELYSLVKVIEVNQIVLDMYGANSYDELALLFSRSVNAWNFSDILVALYFGENNVQVHSCEYKINGEKIYTRDRTVIAPENRDSWSYVIVVSEDITQQTIKDEELAGVEGKIELLANNVPVGLWLENWSGVKDKIYELQLTSINETLEYLNNNKIFFDLLKKEVKIELVNPAVLEQYGYSNSEYNLFLSDYEVYKNKGFHDQVVAFLKGDFNRTVQVEESDRNGELLNFSDTYCVPEEFHHNWKSIVCISQDVTEKLHKEVVINEQLLHLNNAAKVSKMGYWTSGFYGGEDIKYYGERCSLYGLDDSGGVIKQKDQYDFIHPDDIERVRGVFDRSEKNKEGYEVEFRMIGKGGVEIYIREMAEIIIDSGGMAIGYHGIDLDISNQVLQVKKLEEANQKASLIEAQFMDAINAIGDGIALYSKEGQLIKSNKFFNSCFDQFGYDLDIESLSFNVLMQAFMLRTSSNEEAAAAHNNAWRIWCESDYRSAFEFFDGENWYTISRAQQGSGFVITINDISRLKDREKQLQEQKLQLEQLSIRDGLTHIYNRRKFNECLDLEFRRCKRTGNPLSIILCDVDEFKKYNDCYGHIKGDECLQKVAKAVQSQFHRASDVVARYGGEEFAVIMPDTSQEVAEKVADLVRRSVSDQQVPHRDSTNGGYVTLSVGVATAASNLDCNQLDIVKAADLALYAAKDGGRNCVRSQQL